MQIGIFAKRNWTPASILIVSKLVSSYGYPDGIHTVIVRCRTEDQTVQVQVIDEGVGIADIHQAMEPLYTSRPKQERSGMGFMFMEAFMDEVQVESEPGLGTTVTMRKTLGNAEE